MIVKGESKVFFARILETAVRNGQANSGFELLIDEWGTMGKTRPTVNDIFNMSLEMEAFAAASYISEEILKQGQVCPPSGILDTVDESAFVTMDGATALPPVVGNCPDVDDQEFDALLETDLESIAADSMMRSEDNSDFITHPQPGENALKTHNVKYAYLCKITCNFSSKRFIGAGGFACVYEGITARKKAHIAVKRLKSSMDKEAMFQQLNYEIDQLPRLRHPNIIELLGYSNDNSENACLLYPLLPGGTLQKRLRRESGFFPLMSEQRVAIAMGIAQGLNFLHTRTKCLIHRDIKSSNILLDHNHLPKVTWKILSVGEPWPWFRR